MNQEMTENKCDSLSKKNGDTIAQLHHAQKTALDDTATALQSIIRQQQLTEAIDTSHQGNVTDAKKDVIDAMVNLAIASSDGSFAKTRDILFEYGLEDMI